MAANRHVRASDLRIGWVFLNRPSAVVCVLPKPWRPRDQNEVDANPSKQPKACAPLRGGRKIEGEERTIWYCFQGDVLKVDSGHAGAPKERSNEKEADVLAALADHAERPEGDKAGPEEFEGGEEFDEDDNTDRSDDEREQARRLFQVWRHYRKTDGAASSDSQDYHAAMIQLLDTAKCREWANALRLQPDPLFRAQVAARYVDVLHKESRHLRRGYVIRAEHLRTPRGRITPVSAALSDVNGLPSVHCTYEDFASDVPLYRVLVTALRCAGSIVTEAACGGRGGDSDVVRKAGALKQQLCEIEPYSVAQARSAAQHIRLHATHELRWHDALQLAKAVLNVWAPTLANNNDADPTPELSILTAKLWEDIITEALSSAGAGQVLDRADEGLRIQQPWPRKHAGKYRCDVIAKIQERWKILDAKYTLVKPLLWKNSEDWHRKYAAVSVAHTRQLFAYGILWKDSSGGNLLAKDKESALRDVGVVYLLPEDDSASVSGAPARMRAAPWALSVGGLCDRDDLRLYVVEMRFPPVDKCMPKAQRVSNEGLTVFLREVGGALKDELARDPAEN